MRTYESFSPKPFRMRTYKKHRGVDPLLTPELATHDPSLATVLKFFFFHSLAHSFALIKNSTLFFSSNFALFRKKHPGVTSFKPNAFLSLRPVCPFARYLLTSLLLYLSPVQSLRFHPEGE